MRRYKSNFIILKQDKLGYSFRNREPQGRLSIETFGDVSKVMLTIQDLKPETVYKAYLIKAEDTGKSIGVSMGNLFPNQQGKCELRQQYNSLNVLNSGINIDDFNVVAVILASNGEFSSPLVGYKRDAIRWKNNFVEFQNNAMQEEKAEAVQSVAAEKIEKVSAPEMPPVEMPPIEPPLVEQPPVEIPIQQPPAEIPTQQPPAEIPEQQPPIEIPTQQPNEVEAVVEEHDENWLGELPDEDPPVDIRIPTPPGVPIIKDKDEAKDKEQPKKTPPNNNNKQQKEAKPYKAPNNNLPSNNNLGNSDESQVKQPTEQKPSQRFEAESKESKKEPKKEFVKESAKEPIKEAKKEQEKEDLHEIFKAMATRLNQEMLELEKFAFSINNQPAKEQNTEVTQQSAQPVQSAQLDNDISILFKTKVKVSPFKQRRKNITWIKISLKELCYVGIDHFLYMNEPLVVSSVKKYNHLILGEIKDENKTSYILGVPDCYSQDYDAVALKLGFSQFKCCNDVSTTKGEYGYWLMPVSC